MPDEASKENELKYHEILNISVLSINKIKELIKQDIVRTFKTCAGGKDVQKQCWHIIGPAGVGKTEIPSRKPLAPESVVIVLSIVTPCISAPGKIILT